MPTSAGGDRVVERDQSSLTSARGVRASKVAGLMTRLVQSDSGPSFAGLRDIRSSAHMQNVAVAADRLPQPPPIPGGIVDPAETMDGKLTCDDLRRPDATCRRPDRHGPPRVWAPSGSETISSHAYVRGSYTRLRQGRHHLPGCVVTLPADASAARQRHRHRRTQRQPVLHWLTSSSCRCRATFDERRAGIASTRQGRRRSAPHQPGRHSAQRAGAVCRAHTARRIVAPLPLRRQSSTAYVVVTVAVSPWAPGWVCCSPGAPRTPQSRCAGHRDSRDPLSLSPGRPTSSSRRSVVSCTCRPPTWCAPTPWSTSASAGSTEPPGHCRQRRRPTWKGGRKVSPNQASAR